MQGFGKMNLVWLVGEYAGTEAALNDLAEELKVNSKKFVYALRENKLKSLIISRKDLQESKPKPVQSNASSTIEVGKIEQVAASHILLAFKGAERSKATRDEKEAKKLADEFLAKIRKGEDFGKLAAEHSDCPSGKSKNGSLGEFKHGVMAKEFENTAFSLKVGEISGVIKTPFGYHIIRRDK